MSARTWVDPLGRGCCFGFVSPCGLSSAVLNIPVPLHRNQPWVYTGRATCWEALLRCPDTEGLGVSEVAFLCSLPLQCFWSWGGGMRVSY